MSTVTLKGNPFTTVGSLPNVSAEAPKSGALVKADLSELSLIDLRGKRVVLNVFPSIDTPTCATSVRKFNEKAAGLKDAVVVCVSMDLPFAHKRFCGAEGIEDVITASAFRSSFGEDFGLTFADGPLKGLLSRAVIVLDAEGKVLHREQVGETADEPDYDAALAALK